jgi:hypothetical protein
VETVVNLWVSEKAGKFFANDCKPIKKDYGQSVR